MPQPITKPLIASSNFLEFRYEIVTSTYYHASLCFMTTVICLASGVAELQLVKFGAYPEYFSKIRFLFHTAYIHMEICNIKFKSNF